MNEITPEIPNQTQSDRHTFGKKLKALREGKGLDVKDLAHLTKISLPFIFALEDGEFEKLPGEVFGRGFLKNICKVLDEDPKSWIVEYNSLFDAHSPKAKNRPRWSSQRIRSTKEMGKTYSSNPESNDSKLGFKRLGIWVTSTVVLGMVVLFGIGKSFMKSEKPPENKVALHATAPMKEPPLTETKPALADEPQAQQVQTQIPSTHELNTNISTPPKVEEVAQVQEVKKMDAEDQAVPKILGSYGSGAHEVLVTVLEKVKIKHRISKNKSENTEFEPGTYRFAFDDLAELHVYDVSKVSIQFNQRSLGALGPKGHERKFSFSSQKMEGAPQKM